MDTKKSTGGAAFPETREKAGYKGIFEQVPGMTLRDYFAAKAMPVAMEQALRAMEDQDSADAMQLVPQLAYAMADAMIAERYAK